MSSTSEQHRSRFGFHPCSFETFLKLKFLHKHYWITLRQFHCWHRWISKEPQNRRGSKPDFCKAFVEERIWFKPKKSCGIKVFSKTLVDHGVLESYASARHPSAEPAVPFSAEKLSQIDVLYREVKEHFSMT